MQKKILFTTIICILLINFSFAQEMTIKEKVERYKPVTLSAELNWLSDKEKQIIPILIEIADIMDNLFWLQNYGEKEELLNKITDEYEKKYVLINYGPWDQLDGEKPFINGFGEKPKGANFYPIDMTVEEFNNLNDNRKTSPYTILRRDSKGNLIVIPYSVAYEKELKKAHQLMLKAAELAEDKGLKRYLELRAEALITDNYQPSDFAWMDMKTSNIDFVVGPIENYTDGLFGYKTAFESFVLIKDPVWSDKLKKFTLLLPELQKSLPVDEKYKSESPGLESDLNVYDAIYFAGDCNAGSKTIAINLPNDEEVQLKKRLKATSIEKYYES